jgi:hypothetical protein
MNPPVTEIEFEEILNKISSSPSKRKRLQTGKILLEEVIERCLANGQNYPELFEKCLSKILLSSKDFDERAAEEEEDDDDGNRTTRRKESVVSRVIRMYEEGKTEEEIDKFLLG